MATRIQFRRGTSAQHASFTGAVGEMTVDTDKDVVVVHDGSTAGGFEMLREDLSNINISGTASSGKTILSDGDGTFTWGDGGQILQIKYAQTIATQYFTSKSFTDVTALSVAITPKSSSSKIMCLVNAKFSTSDSSSWGGGHIRLLRGSTVIGAGSHNTDIQHQSMQGGLNGYQHHYPKAYGGNWLDSPATTSSTTYKVQWAETNYQGSGSYLNRSYGGSNSYGGTSSSSLIVMEVIA